MEATLFKEEWEAVLADLGSGGREAVFTGRVAQRSPDALDLEVAAAITLGPGMTSSEVVEVLRRHVRRPQEGRIRVLAIYGSTGLLEKKLDVPALSGPSLPPRAERREPDPAGV
jgi:hypothetical protein